MLPLYQRGSIASCASAGIARAEMSIRLSHSGIVSKRYCFITVGEHEHSSFWKYPDHPEIRKGSPRERVIYETGVGMNWRFFYL